MNGHDVRNRHVGLHQHTCNRADICWGLDNICFMYCVAILLLDGTGGRAGGGGIRDTGVVVVVVVSLLLLRLLFVALLLLLLLLRMIRSTTALDCTKCDHCSGVTGMV